MIDNASLVFLMIVFISMFALFLAIEGNRILYSATGCGFIPHGNGTYTTDWYWDCR